MTDANNSSYQPLETAPKDGTVILVAQETPYRWNPYSEKAPQFKQGIVGRWQRYRSGAGWENEEPSGTGWRVAEFAAPGEPIKP